MFVGAQNVFLTAEGADQHEQRGLREVEVGQHRLDHFEFEAWIDEEVCCGSARDDGSCAECEPRVRACEQS